jgi:hypothetical protein
MALEPEDAEDLEDILAGHEQLGHLRVKRRGDSLAIYSGEAPDSVLHARLTHLGRGQWGLSLPRHTGRWERTPFMDTMEEVMTTLIANFGFYLDDPAADAHPNQRRTYDPSN